ncbi:hypothetical protein LTR70_006738 [Exophiala xenobiotica]|uniref:Uncharacterized protein n=1 Tax=Lithohypha guttulata TaxID=1690604 RepID=A0ABR0KAN9_9EURO|nr:hypothetical protein LTR24_005004 [Lithohypha guttulata]KAK5315399.1 hypothetical protein LTR70_006738 [Exophiala xenobiotica]
MPLEEDDPVMASYNVYISPHSPSTTSETPTKSAQNLYVLQYPSHRPSSKPYSSSRAQKPTSLRIKSNTGVLEVDVPILTSDNYNGQLGSQFGRAMNESAKAHPTTGSSYGLAGGFAQNHPGNQQVNLDDVPEHGMEDDSLKVQTLGGKLDGARTDRDPIYMLATLNQSNKSISLRHLDGVVQMRPQLHHIDAEEERKRRAETATKREAKSEQSGNVNGGPVKLETKAIEMKLKDSTREDPKDRNLNLNARLLREIQNDPWRKYEWIEKGEEAHSAMRGVGSVNGAGEEKARLKSALDNEEWLNRMSSPGIELRTRLKGRDRERARRKRQERLRNARAAEANSAAGGLPASGEIEVGSETESSEEEEGEEADIGPALVGGSGTVDANVESEATRPKSPEPQIKQEGDGGNVTAAGAVAAPRKRGRPPKNAGLSR